MKTSVAKEEGTEPAQKKIAPFSSSGKPPLRPSASTKWATFLLKEGGKGEGRSVDWGRRRGRSSSYRIEHQWHHQ